VRVDAEHALVQAVRFGEGIIFSTPLSLWESDPLLGAIATNTLLEALSRAGVEHVLFERPLPQDSQLACGKKKDKLVVCVVNHTSDEAKASMRLPRSLRRGAVVTILGVDGTVRKVGLSRRQAEAGVRFGVPAHWFALMLFEAKQE